MRSNIRNICYAFVAFGLSGCANMDAEKVTQAFAMGLTGGAAIYANGANYVQPVYQPTYIAPTQRPGVTYFLKSQSNSATMRFCHYQNGAMQTVSISQLCPLSYVHTY